MYYLDHLCQIVKIEQQQDNQLIHILVYFKMFILRRF